MGHPSLPFSLPPLPHPLMPPPPSPLMPSHPPSPPADLTISNANFERGFNRIYDWNLAGALRRIMGKHEMMWNRVKVRGRGVLAKRLDRLVHDSGWAHEMMWDRVKVRGRGVCSSWPNPRGPPPAAQRVASGLPQLL